jgi:hypothetical protein
MASTNVGILEQDEMLGDHYDPVRSKVSFVP